jgi:hypothetical protein
MLLLFASTFWVPKQQQQHQKGCSAEPTASAFRPLGSSDCLRALGAAPRACLAQEPLQAR